jgi:hypothetical protein
MGGKDEKRILIVLVTKSCEFNSKGQQRALRKGLIFQAFCQRHKRRKIKNKNGT